jgi:hypothetical protein
LAQQLHTDHHAENSPNADGHAVDGDKMMRRPGHVSHDDASPDGNRAERGQRGADHLESSRYFWTAMRTKTLTGTQSCCASLRKRFVCGGVSRTVVAVLLSAMTQH